MQIVSVAISIYLAAGNIEFNDVRINKRVSIEFKQRPALYIFFLALIILTFALGDASSIGETRIFLASIYLFTDLLLLIWKTRFTEVSPSLSEYKEVRMLRKVSLVGFSNLYCIILITAYLLKSA